MNFSYQKKHVSSMVSLLQQKKNILDRSKMGLGKTYTTIQLAEKIGYAIYAVVPASAIAGWEEAYQNLNATIKMELISYDRARQGNGVYVLTGKKRKPFQLEKRIKTLYVFDEAHRCKNYKTLNAKLLIAAAASGNPVVMLSATIASSPLHLEAVGAALGIFKNRNDYFQFAFSHGVVRNQYGLVFYSSTGALESISNLLSPFSVAMPEDKLPDVSILPELITLPEKDIKELKKLYGESSDLVERIEEIEKDDADCVLTERLRSSQKIEAIKLSIIYNRALDMLDQGKAVIIVLKYKESIKWMKKKFPDAAEIQGGQKKDERNQERLRFQNDETRVCLLNLKAGSESISLHDITGKHPRVMLMCPDDNEIDVYQTTGRVVRAGGKSKSLVYLLYVKRTVEEAIYRNVKKKLNSMSVINKGEKVIV